MRVCLNKKLKAKRNEDGMYTYPLYVEFTAFRQTYQYKCRIADFRMTQTDLEIADKGVHSPIGIEILLNEYLKAKYCKDGKIDISAFKNEYRETVKIFSIQSKVNEIGDTLNDLEPLIAKRAKHPIFKNHNESSSNLKLVAITDIKRKLDLIN